MDDWDADDFIPPPVSGGASKFEDELQLEEKSIPESWDAEPTKVQTTKSSKEAQKAVKNKEASKVKKPVAVNKARAVELDSFADKTKKQNAVEDADFQNTQEMFSGLDSVSIVNTADPKDEKDFEVLAETLSKKLVVYEKSIHYKAFLKSFTKQLANVLKVEEIKELSASLALVANDKLKNEKNAGKKKKGLTKKIVKKGEDDDEEGEDGFVTGEYDEYSDFM